MPKTKASLLLVAATALTVAVLFCLPVSPKITVHTAAVEEGDLIRTTLLEGVVGYRDQQPCVTLRDGKVAQVHVAQGECVQMGDLLFTMDTSVAQAALASLEKGIYEQQSLLENVDTKASFVSLLAQQGAQQYRQKAELEAEIRASQVRAAFDGVVGGVYQTEGSYVPAMAVLGEIHGNEKQITAVGRSSELIGVNKGAVSNVKRADGEKLGVAQVLHLAAPEVDAQTGAITQTMRFEPMDEAVLSNADVGDRMTLELVCEVASDRALVPISALDGSDRIWVVENGKATPYRVDVTCRNDHYVAIDRRWLGKRVILSPNEETLSAGCAVKEGKLR